MISKLEQPKHCTYCITDLNGNRDDISMVMDSCYMNNVVQVVIGDLYTFRVMQNHQLHSSTVDKNTINLHPKKAK